MTPRQVALVQSSFARIVPMADAAAALFYGRLFEVAPDFRPLFPADMGPQKEKLIATLATIVNGLSDINGMRHAIHALGARHHGYGVVADHYPTVGAALLWTLQMGLDDAFDMETEEAWAAAYTLLAFAMLDGAEAAA